MNKLTVWFILCLSLLYNSTYALGSYMFCVNKNNSWDWKWAPAMNHPLAKYAANLSPNSSGTYIYGLGDTNGYAHLILDTIYSRFEAVEDAQEFCNYLAKICTDAYGPDYFQVGVAGYAVAPTSWTYISVNYLTGKGSASSVCPNWKYSDFPNDGGEINYQDPEDSGQLQLEL